MSNSCESPGRSDPDLTLGKLILEEAAKGNFCAPSPRPVSGPGKPWNESRVNARGHFRLSP